LFGPIQRRAAYILALRREKLWGAWLGGLYALLTLYVFVRDDFWQPKDADHWWIIKLVPHLTLSWWLFGWTLLLLVWVYEASFRVTRRLRGAIDLHKSQAALEIIFDPSNPHKKFWSRILIQMRPNGLPVQYCDEYRVLIRNNSNKTITNVNVARESSGFCPILSEDILFQKDGKAVNNLDPGRSEIVNIFWVYPPQAGDAWGETAKAFHGPIKITVSGEDVPPAECEFDYCPDELPALVMRWT